MPMYYVTMCTGNCATCSVERSVSQAPQAEDSPAENAPVTARFMEAAEDTVEQNSDAGVELRNADYIELAPLDVAGLPEIASSPVIDAYTVRKTRKGLVGKLLGV